MLSILIVNWNTRDLLLACLASLARHPAPEGQEVIVVDNASADGSAAAVRTHHPEVRLIEPGQNTGYALGNNLAFAEARGDWLLTLNPDTEVEPDTLALALDSLARHPGWGCLGARLILPDGSTQRSVRGFPTPLGVVGESLRLHTRFPRGPLGAWALPEFDYEQEGLAPQPMGTFLLFRREALAAVGDPRAPFDPGFPIYFNEVDLLVRLARAGWPCGYDPSVVVHHHHGSSTRQVRASMIWESHRSLLRYFGKHLRGAERAWLPLLAGAVFAGAFVRARGYHAGFRP